MLRAMLRLCLIAISLFVASCAPTYLKPYPVEDVNVPEDEAAHPAPIEWWYYTGHFADEAGKDYGFELTFFKGYAPPSSKLLGFIPAFWLIEKGYVAHFAITDLSEQNFDMAERADYWGYDAYAASDRFDVALGDWYARETFKGTYEIYAEVGGKRLRLELTPTKPVSLHGDPPGIQSMGPGGISYYLSYTRMQAEGTLETCTAFRCSEQKVRGQAWHDHQWGDFTLSGYAGWDWFSLQFNNETELMLYFIRQPSGEYGAAGGSFVTTAGETLELSEGDIIIEPTGRTYTSEDTGAIYPLAWRVQVPKYRIDTEVSALMDAQEMNTRASTGIVYWEGAVEAVGRPSGLGYVELTNYDLYPFGQTDESTPLKPLSTPFNP